LLKKGQGWQDSNICQKESPFDLINHALVSGTGPKSAVVLPKVFA
jgi:hypothetical protein